MAKGKQKKPEVRPPEAPEEESKEAEPEAGAEMTPEARPGLEEPAYEGPTVEVTSTFKGGLQEEELPEEVTPEPEPEKRPVSWDPPTVASLWDKPGVAVYVEGYWANPNEQALRQAVADWIGKGKGTLLDVGCGSARVAPMLEGWEYTGLDSSLELLVMASARVEASRLVTHDLTEPLPFKDNEFDVVMIMNVLRHLPSYEAVVAEMARVARRYVYIVDMFSEADSHKYEKALVASQEFGNNTWSLPLLLADIGRLTGWKAERHSLEGLAWPVTGVRMEAQ